MHAQSFRIDRRTTLAWLSAAVASAATGVFPTVSFADTGATSPTVAAKGYGSDPDLQNPTVPWPKTMTLSQLQIAAILADLILPPTDTAPAPSAVGIPDFVDEWVSAPYPDQRRDRNLILPGLLWLDTESNKRWATSFPDTTPERRLQLLAEIATRPTTADRDMALRYGFFRAFRSVAVGAYYSLERNFPEIGYIGNTPLEAFPPPSEEDLAFINKAIAKLGL